jgi:hypothetical protein
VPTPDMMGPYSATDNGVDMVGHPVNGYGRCEQLNTTGVCPTKDQNSDWLYTQTVAFNVEYARELGVPALTVEPTNELLVPLIIGVLWP